eukprot:c18595_g1_i3.p1 GENE.c18595_g1_i3~~c18595_g1_i3.p1  ORF type:complete len:236 (-),score=74.52 c18595_g1_i3:67-774(-)
MFVVRAKEIVCSPTQTFIPGVLVINDQGLVEFCGEISEFEQSELSKSIKSEINVDIVVPGFVDIHFHGLGGSDNVNTFWGNPQYSLTRVIKYGTTSVLSTLTFPTEFIKQLCGDIPFPDKSEELQMINQIKQVVQQISPNSAVLEGIHAEGPIVSDLGGLPEGENSLDELKFNNFLNSLAFVKVMTLSPHEDAKKQYMYTKALLKKNIVPSYGHDRKATEDEIIGALRVAKAKIN